MSRSQDIADLREDARHVRVTAAILRGRSRKPDSFMLRVLCRVLEKAADGLDRKADAL
jgi:hypothetical protein